MTAVAPLITSNPQTITGGTYANLAATINTRRWRLVVTPTLASTAFTGGLFHVVFGQPSGGLAFVNATIELDDDTDALMISKALTWSAGQALTFTVEMRTGIRSLTIAGATTGNGTFSISNTNPIIAAGTDLTIGNVPPGNVPFAGTVSSFDDTAPDMSWTPQMPPLPARRTAATAALVAALVAPPVVPAPPAPPLSWAPTMPEVQLRSRSQFHVGGEFAPTTIVPPPVAPAMSWTSVFPDLIARARPSIGYGGGATGPVTVITNTPAPLLSWAPTFPDIITRAAPKLPVGGMTGPEAVIPNVPAPGMAWVSQFPDLIARPRRPVYAASGESAPPFAGGKSLTLGGMRVRQNILSALAFSTPLTTFGTNITFTAAAGTTLTATAHGMVNCAGPFTLTTTGTLPGGVDGTTLYYCAQPTDNTFHLALSAANADTSTFVTLADAGTGTHTLVRKVDTAPLYSTFVSIISRGTQASAPDLPTDNKGNTYAYVAGTPSFFSSFPASAFSVAVVIGGKGGNAHTWSTSIGNIGGSQDEVLASGLEIFNARILQDSSNIEQPDGGLAIITSNPVTTTARAILIAIVGGNSNVGQENFWTFFDGFVKLPYISAEGDPSPSGYDQVCVAAKLVDIKGTYTFRAQGTVRGGGGPSGGKMILLAFQAQSSDLQPLDWNYPQAEAPRRARTLPPGIAGETAPLLALAATTPPLSWAPKFPDMLARVARQPPAGESAAPVVPAPLLSWAPTFPDLLARPRALPPGAENAPPSFGDSARLLTWLPNVLGPMTARRTQPPSGETSPPIMPAPPLWWPSFPDRIARAPGRIPSGEVAPPVLPAAPAVPPISSWAPSFPDALARQGARIQGGESSLVFAPAAAIVPSIASWSPTFPHALARVVFRHVTGEVAPPTVPPPPIAPPAAGWMPLTTTIPLRTRAPLPAGAVGPVLVIPQPPAPPLWAPTLPELPPRRRVLLIAGEVGPLVAALNLKPALVRLAPIVTMDEVEPLIVTVEDVEPLIVTVEL